MTLRVDGVLELYRFLYFQEVTCVYSKAALCLEHWAWMSVLRKKEGFRGF